MEATVRPENRASRKVLAKVGFREEGLLKRYLDVDGAWRDHLLVGLTVEEVRGRWSPDWCTPVGRAWPVCGPSVEIRAKRPARCASRRSRILACCDTSGSWCLSESNYSV